MVSLEYAKKYINLVEFAVNKFGYKIKKNKSSRYYKTLKNEGDIIVVSKNLDNGHWIYFNTRDDEDNGTIIDFIQNRTGYNLGKVRKILSEYLKEKKEGKIKEIKDFYLEPATSNEVKTLLKELEELEKIQENNYLTKDRYISKKTLTDLPIYQDRKNNISFILLDSQGKVIGIAKYNKNFKQIIGKKGVWISLQEDINEDVENEELRRKKLIDKVKKINEIFITESPIDALSYVELKNIDLSKTILIATQGQISEKTVNYIYAYLKAIYKYSECKDYLKIKLGFDNDEAGYLFALKIKNNLTEKMQDDKDTFKKSLYIKIEFPKLKDWNEELKKKKHTK